VHLKIVWAANMFELFRIANLVRFQEIAKLKGFYKIRIVVAENIQNRNGKISTTSAVSKLYNCAGYVFRDVIYDITIFKSLV